MENKFGIGDYIVFVLVLVVSAAIGIFYGCFGSKQKTAEEFLMANRQMSYFPVALSLMCSFVSAVMFLGFPAEIYLYGGQFALFGVAFIPVTLMLIYFYVPVYFNLQLTSAFQYLELRFSPGTRKLVTVIGIFNLVFYMAVVVYGPSLALEQVTGLHSRTLTAAVLIVCIFYSSIGGLKTVLWSDTFQGLIMISSSIAVITKGIYDVGGLNVVWERAANSNRTEFINFDPDPRTRYTVWSILIGSFFTFLPIHATSQGQVQRYVSLPSMSSCKKALVISMVGHILLISMSTMAGYVVYAKYFDCDPISTNRVSRTDQLLPLYVIESLGSIPGLPGLFVAGITAASLSTVSSGLNAVAAVVTFDIIKKRWPQLNDERLSLISKISSLLVGIIVYGFIFAVEHMGSILPAALSILNTLGGPVLGIFTLGMFFPWANSKGAMLATILSLSLMTTFAFGVHFANTMKLLPNQVLSLSTSGCTTTTGGNFSLTLGSTSTEFQLNWKENEDNYLIKILSISYMWQSALGFCMTIIFGLIFSQFFSRLSVNKKNRKNHVAVRGELISPPMLFLWRKLCPNLINEWVVEPTEDALMVPLADMSSVKDVENK